MIGLTLATSRAYRKYFLLFLSRHTNIMDNMVNMLEKYANNLESLVEERTSQLAEEKRKTDNLLHRMLPAWVWFSLSHVNLKTFTDRILTSFHLQACCKWPCSRKTRSAGKVRRSFDFLQWYRWIYVVIFGEHAFWGKTSASCNRNNGWRESATWVFNFFFSFISFYYNKFLLCGLFVRLWSCWMICILCLTTLSVIMTSTR